MDYTWENMNILSISPYDLNKSYKTNFGATKVGISPKKIQKLEYERKLRQMDMETMIKIRERREHAKDMKKKNKSGLTGM